MNILFIGDIVGSPGRLAVREILPKIKKRNKIDFTIANAENSAGGSGITVDVADELFDIGVDVITSGDHIWKKKEFYSRLNSDKRILRPLNYPKPDPGSGVTVVESTDGASVAVINLLGRVFMDPIDCPFKAVEEALREVKDKASVIIVDIHAEATSEKIALGKFLDGRASAVIGTHTHVQTADEAILPKGTAYITDTGMTGPFDSVIGRKAESIIERFLTQMPTKFEVAAEDIRLQGVIVSVDEKTGIAAKIERVHEKL